MNSKIYLAGGCFWCTEAIFNRVEGVKKVIPGYIGGNLKNPSYKEVCSGKTGHAEAISLEFDKNIILLDKLLLIFFQTHDPTQLNRQGNDFGTQYRSAIFYTDIKQKKITENIIKKLSQSIYKNKEIVTKIELAKETLGKGYPRIAFEVSKNLRRKVKLTNEECDLLLAIDSRMQNAENLFSNGHA